MILREMTLLLPRFLHPLRTSTSNSATSMSILYSTMTSHPLYKANPLLRSAYPSAITYTTEDFQRRDENLDAQWYSQPRFLQHIDDGAIEALKAYYGTIIQIEHSVLDICSSWVSHMPSPLKPSTMIGIGMNAEELQMNKHLTKFLVRDLNTSPNLQDIPDESIDVVICNVSVDYLIQPISIFREMRRVLKIKGTAHMAFSNRCFPTKVIGRWLDMDDEERRKWIGGYFWASGGWEDVEEVILKAGNPGFLGLANEDPLFVVRARRTAGGVTI